MDTVNDVLTALADGGLVVKPFQHKQQLAAALVYGGFDVTRLDDDDFNFIFRWVRSGPQPLPDATPLPSTEFPKGMPRLLTTG